MRLPGFSFFVLLQVEELLYTKAQKGFSFFVLLLWGGDSGVSGISVLVSLCCYI